MTQASWCLGLAIGWALIGSGCAWSMTEKERLQEEAKIERGSEGLDEGIQEANRYAYIHGQGVGAPIGKLLLIRRNRQLCAVRFTDPKRGYDGSLGTWFSSGKESVYASYDWYYQGDGSGDLTKPNVEFGQGEVSRLSWVGITFHLSFPRGNRYVECGDFEFEWGFPHVLAFPRQSDRFNPNDFAMAPTNWTQVSEINLQDPKIRWYTFNDTTESGRGSRDSAETLPGGTAPPTTPGN